MGSCNTELRWVFRNFFNFLLIFLVGFLWCFVGAMKYDVFVSLEQCNIIDISGGLLQTLLLLPECSQSGSCTRD